MEKGKKKRTSGKNKEVRNTCWRTGRRADGRVEGRVDGRNEGREEGGIKCREQE